MDHPFWKKIISHFKDVSLETTSSLYNPYLEVLLVKGRHQLVTRDAIYSFDDKYINFLETFKKIDWDKFHGDRVLILGLGLGSIMLILEKNCKKKFSYTAVEIDPEICRLCSDYTLSKLDSFVEVIPAEGLRFLETTNEKYDMVIMDIFQSAIIPQKFQTQEYLELLKGTLNDEGIILFNRMNITISDKEKNDQFKLTMEKVFPRSTYLEINDNKVMINDADFLID